MGTDYRPEIVDQNDAAKVFRYQIGTPRSKRPIVLTAPHACIDPGETDHVKIAKELGIAAGLNPDQVADQNLYSAAIGADGKIDFGGVLHEIAKRLAEQSGRPVYVVASRKSRLRADLGRHESFVDAPDHGDIPGLVIDRAEARTSLRLFQSLVKKYKGSNGAVVAVHTMKQFSSNGNERPAVSVVAASTLVAKQMLNALSDAVGEAVAFSLGRFAANDPYDAANDAQLAAKVDLSAPIWEIRSDLAKTRPEDVGQPVADAIWQNIQQGIYDKSHSIASHLVSAVKKIRQQRRRENSTAYSAWPLIGGKRVLPRQMLQQNCGPSVIATLEILMAAGYVQAAGNWQKPAYLNNIHQRSKTAITGDLDQRQAELAQQLGTRPKDGERPGTSFAAMQGFVEANAAGSRAAQITDINQLKPNDYPAIVCVYNKIRQAADNAQSGHYLILLGERDGDVICYDPLHQGLARYKKSELKLKTIDDSIADSPSSNSVIFLRRGALNIERLLDEPIVNRTNSFTGVMPPWYKYSWPKAVWEVFGGSHGPSRVQAARYRHYFAASAQPVAP